MVKFYVVILILFYFIQSISAQVNEYQFNYLKIDDGLSSNRINCFFEDSLGFMWIGTDNGLNRFDGSSIKVFSRDVRPGFTIHENIKVIEPAFNSPHFWVGTTNGLYFFDLHTYKGSTVPESTDTAGLIQSIAIMDLKTDKKGALWIASRNNIYRYDTIVTQLTQNEEVYRRETKARYQTITISPNSDIFIGGENGIYRFNPENESVDLIKNTEGIGDVVKLYFDSDGDLWAGTLEDGAYRFKDGNPDVEPEHFSAENGKLISNLALDIIEYEKGEMFILNKEAGITVYNKIKSQFEYIIPSIADPRTLNTKAITSFSKDSKMNLWVGSFNNGVNFIDRNQKKIAHYNLNFGGHGLFNNNVRAFFEDSQGYIWIGTKEDGGLSRFDPQTRTFKHYRANKSDRNALQGDNVTTINEIDKRYLVVGTFLNGLQVLDRKTDKFKQYVPDKNNPFSITDRYVTAFAKHPDGRMLIAHGKGVDLFDIEKEAFTPFFRGMSGRCFYVENSDSIWLGTLHGLYLLSPNADVIRVYNNKKTAEGTPYILNVNSVMAVNKDSNANIWIASGYDGLHKLSDDRTKATRYKYPGIGSKNKVVGMLIDDHNNIWFSSKEGISKFSDSTKTFQHFNRLDGLQGDQFEIHAALKTSKGYMLFGGRNGFNIFHPDSIKLNLNPPKVVLTGFKIFDREVDVGTKDSPLTKHISQTQSIILNYQQSMLSFDYVAINFSSPLKDNYTYMMEGVDNDWRYVGNTRNATYTNMREGDYVFKVKASNNDGVWNEEGAKLYITILPPWWRTLWFRVFLFASILSVLFGIYYIRVKRLKHQQKELKLKVQERTIELAHKNELLQKQAAILNESNEELSRLNATKDKFFSIIAHDLRNPFTSIIGLCDLLMEQYRTFDDDERYGIISGIDRSTKKVFQLLENLLNWARSQRKSIKIDTQEISPFHVISGIQDLVTDDLDKKNLEMIITIPKDLSIESDPNLFETIFRNFISNSIKFSSNGKLEIIGEELNGNIRITVKDCGIGMSQKTIDQLFNSHFIESTFGTMGEPGTGIGLVICRDFIAILRGQLKVQSELGVGSSFIVELPKVI